MMPLILLDETDLRGCCPVSDEPGLGALTTARGNLPLKLLEVEARVVGLFAETTLRQTYVNTLGVPLEATYIFPLPDRAAVTRFRLEVGERVVEGELQERGQARATYDRAVRTGHRAAIAEEERPGVFTLRVGNLMPGDEATVWLTFSGPVPFADGEATYQLPLVVAPRYIPGSALPGEQAGDGVAHDTDAVPDASRISPPVLLPGFPSPVRLSITVDIDPAGLPLGAVRSSLHAVSTAHEGSGVRVKLVPGERLDRDFVLRFGLGGAALVSSLVLSPDDADGATSTFCLTLVPPGEEARARRPKDVVLVLDRSGSMNGWKMVAARRATARMVDTLTPLDRFAIYAFDDQLETPRAFGGEELVWASDRNRFRAVEFLARLESRGGTEMAHPLRRATRALLQGSSVGEVRDRVLVLITDGQVGNEDQILRTLGPELGRLRVFTLGVDQAVNAAFLRRLAALGGGSCELVESEDRLDEVMDKVHRRIDTPVLTDLRLDATEGLEVLPDSLVPARLPDLFPGAPVTILGRCRGRAGTISVRAVDGAGLRYGETIAATSAAHGRPITAAWARGQIRQLEDRYLIAHGRERVQLERQITDVSLRWSVLCRFTAYVAVDRAEVVNEGGRVHRVTQAVEQPAGWNEQAQPKTGAFKRSRSASAPAPTTAPETSREPFDPFGAGPVGGLVSDAFAAPSGFGPSAGSAGDPFAAPAAFGGPPAGDPFAPAAADPFGDAFAPSLESADDLDAFDTGPPAPPMRASSRGAAPSPPPVGGLFQAAKDMFGLSSETSASAGPEFDGYRRRAEDLVKLLAGRISSTLERQRELGRLVVLLERLLDDLRSVGAPGHLVRPIEDLVRELEVIRRYAAGQLDDRELERLWQRAAGVLQAYVRGAGSAPAPDEPTTQPPPAGGGRREFWKS